jgi:hypothetical protein
LPQEVLKKLKTAIVSEQADPMVSLNLAFSLPGLKDVSVKSSTVNLKHQAWLQIKEDKYFMEKNEPF